MTIPIGVSGVIVNSSRAGHRVRVVDDLEGSGGYLIYEWWPCSDGPNRDNGFDAWIEQSQLEQLFRESNWQVQWDGSL